MSLYKKNGEPIGYLTLTQGNVPHNSYSSQVPMESVEFRFMGSVVAGKICHAGFRLSVEYDDLGIPRDVFYCGLQRK